MPPLLVLLALPSSLAGEGMWRPDQLPALSKQLTELGVEVPAAELADLQAGPLAALVDLDFCSGAVVSPEGLVATAYHCIGEGLQFASERGEDLFEQGFHAPTRAEERWAGPGFRARVTTELRDVTEAVHAGTRRLAGPPRAERIDANIRGLVRRCESAPGRRCDVASFDDGAAYQLVVQREFRDVRLVYAPPRSVGYFGGDSDNWQWPRHSGDFAFVRVYARGGTRSADHHEKNEPWKAPRHLEVAHDGPAPGDPILVPGYPAETFRWRTAAELEAAQTELYPRRIATGRAVLDILLGFADQDRVIATRLAPRILALANEVQYLEGNLDAFERTGAVHRKWRFEQDLGLWIASDPERSARWGSVQDTLHRLQADEAAHAERDHVMDALVEHVGMLDVAMRLYTLASEAGKPDARRRPGYQDRDRTELAEWLDSVDAGYDWRVDQWTLRHFLLAALKLPEGLRVPELELWFTSLPHTGTLEERLDQELARLYRNTALHEAAKRRALMETSTWYLEHSDVPWFTLAAMLHPYVERTEEARRERAAAWSEARPMYLEAVQAFLAADGPHADQQQYYPDANATLRVSFGVVQGYEPRDGLYAGARTRLQGLVEKHGDPPYDAPPELLAAISRGAYGSHLDEDLGSVAVNYLSTADTTLGNSGSPSLDGKGRWVGVLFDGNYESMATDWLFEAFTTRSIHTHSDYVLWYLDAVVHADALLVELGVPPSVERPDDGALADQVEVQEPATADR